MDDDRDTREFDEADVIAADITAAYVDALGSGDAGTLIDLLADGVRFVSPYSSWTTRRDVVAACTARTRAFTGLEVTSAVREERQVSIRWTAAVGETTVEGVDALTLGPNGVRTIDTFLRPAAALDEVYAAMRAAWAGLRLSPRSGRPAPGRTPRPAPAGRCCRARPWPPRTCA